MSSVSPIIIAVDGPAGAGKSSVCRGTARLLGWHYLDTGAMYRAMTWAVLHAGIDPADAAAVAAFAPTPVIASGTDPDAPTIVVDGTDVSAAIREPDVTTAVSAVSAVPKVRELLVARQREAARAALQSGTGIVVEGRDITTVVLPNAQVKIFLTADPQIRAQRRAKEEAGSAPVAGDAVRATQEALQRRDQLDSTRAASPLTQSKDAAELDTSHLTLDEVIEEVIARARAASR
ncbi:MAG: (d)CMP kinase [Candidatus Nanopelagicales bacterium]|nr:(d)CMP kinase [Candidatus Nanopelagicales bacterium]